MLADDRYLLGALHSLVDLGCFGMCQVHVAIVVAVTTNARAVHDATKATVRWASVVMVAKTRMTATRRVQCVPAVIVPEASSQRAELNAPRMSASAWIVAR
jgi:hypothetical protein